MLGGADRSRRIAAAGEFDVIICSYGLLPQVLKDLEARAWHTLVLREPYRITVQTAPYAPPPGVW